MNQVRAKAQRRREVRERRASQRRREVREVRASQRRRRREVRASQRRRLQAGRVMKGEESQDKERERSTRRHH